MKLFLSLLLLCSFIHLNGMEIVQEKFCECTCGKQYVRKMMLEKHIQQNTKNSVCKLCNQSFFLTCCFKRHLQLDHEIKLHLCCLCFKDFKYKQNLMTHIKNDHPKPSSPLVHPMPSEKSIPSIDPILAISPTYLSNLTSLLNTQNFSLYSYQPPLDDSLFLQWMHNT